MDCGKLTYTTMHTKSSLADIVYTNHDLVVSFRVICQNALSHPVKSRTTGIGAKQP